MTKLSEYLEAEGISQRSFAERLEVDPGTVSRLAAGKLTPRLALALRIANITGGVVPPEAWAKSTEQSPSAPRQEAS